MRSIDPQNGHMTVEQAYISKANVCPYFGRDIPDSAALGLDPNKVYYLLRSSEELARAADTASNLPLLEHHQPITASAPARDLWVGTTGTVTYEHPYLVSRPLKVWTQRAIDLITSEAQRELSSGYGYVADMTPGYYEGERYDGVMRQLRFNHVAIVSEGRVGPDVCVPDEMPQELSSMSKRSAAITVAAALAALAAAGMKPEDITLAMDKKAKDDADRDREEKLEREEANDANEAGMDAREEELDKREEAEDAGKSDAECMDRKRARDSRKSARDARMAARDKRAADRKSAKDADTDHREDFEPMKGKDNAITQDQLDAAIKLASDEATKRATALFQAREDVKATVGAVALDSAEDVYAFGLKHLGVDTAGVHPSAFRQLFLVASKGQKVETKKDDASLALDAAGKGYTVSSIWQKRAA